MKKKGIDDQIDDFITNIYNFLIYLYNYLHVFYKSVAKITERITQSKY